MKKRLVWHVTNIGNLRSIEREGLSWRYARGATPCVWFAAYGMLPWAFGHVRYNHGWYDNDLLGLQLCVPADLLIATSSRSIYKGVVKEDYPWSMVRDSLSYIRMASKHRDK